ncbi:mitochondrial dicarboxylate carrier [Drosophila obscura]|uniref:mitochondrial dicarboxylate carrier n=1 Tax=Drosophila obscura TaxID=7282 RepID=UPI001BB18AF8|nr:mitochondrial dicarboxylate carrier [Drosophila obscura]XP_041448956.1 mitochondrial dicarboxylate carrier [Drosophila obscura]
MVIVKQDRTMAQTIRLAIKEHGLFSLYDGLSAQLLRQMTYVALRFHLYETGKRYVDEYNFLHKVGVASVAGVVAGCVGIPTELVNTRMHVDRALPEKNRRNYRNVFHGLYKVIRDEGWMSLYHGGSYSCVRGALITIGQNAVYDQAKMNYRYYLELKDDSKVLHVISSLTAALLCGPLCQPIEILKTLRMTTRAPDGGKADKFFSYMMRFGPRGLFRGAVPSLMRMVPNTILTFVLFEQFRLYFGYYDDVPKAD